MVPRKAQPVTSPDGEYSVFLNYRSFLGDDLEAQLYIKGRDGRTRMAMRVSQFSDYVKLNRTPVWSPDSRFVAVLKTEEPKGAIHIDDVDIYDVKTGLSTTAKYPGVRWLPKEPYKVQLKWLDSRRILAYGTYSSDGKIAKTHRLALLVVSADKSGLTITEGKQP
jgi:hypothetical protein